MKLTIVRLLKDDAYDSTAEMLGYCMPGALGFTEANGLRLTEATEALVAGDSLDARLFLLALHAGVIQEQVVERGRTERGESRAPMCNSCVTVQRITETPADREHAPTPQGPLSTP